MNVPEEFIQLITDEIKAVEQKMEAAGSPGEKLYYFSAVYGTINKVMNFHTDPVLIFAYQILQLTHHAVNARLDAPKKPGQEAYLGVPEKMIDAILAATKDLRSAFAKYASLENADADMWTVLKRFANISYAATGNGYYLFLREKLKL